jgi:hypothetical protein
MVGRRAMVSLGEIMPLLKLVSIAWEDSTISSSLDVGNDDAAIVFSTALLP